VTAVAARGVRHAFIDAGELGARGHRADGSPWRLAVAHPREQGGTVAGLDLSSLRFAATSADNRCTWTEDFSEHHIVEPWSGHSPTGLAEVAVVASSGLIADGLSTTAMVMGRERAPALLALDPGASAIFVDKAGRTTTLGTEFAAS
jgi:thiamine biosynthesis lipoprotein